VSQLLSVPLRDDRRGGSALSCYYTTREQFLATLSGLGASAESAYAIPVGPLRRADAKRLDDLPRHRISQLN